MSQNDRPHRFRCRPQVRLTLPFRKVRRLLSIGLCVLAAAIGLSRPAVAIDGQLDPVFDADGLVLTDIQSRRRFDVIRALVVQPDGKPLAVGRSTSNNDSDFALARYHPNGSLDPSFGNGGVVLTDVSGTGSTDRALAVVLQPDGKIVVAGFSDAGDADDFALARYHPNGSLDPSFDGDGLVLTDFSGNNSVDEAHALVLQADGKLVAAGWSDANDAVDFALARYHSDGTLDTSFHGDGLVVTDFSGSGSFDRAFGVALQADGKLVAAGETFSGNSFDFALARYNADGSLDTGFDADGLVRTDFSGTGSDDRAVAVSALPDHRLIVSGASGARGSDDFALARYTADGRLDPGFDADGLVLTDFSGTGSLDRAADHALQADGKIVLAGRSTARGSVDFALARYNADGGLDPVFDGDGLVVTNFVAGDSFDRAWAVAIQPDGQVVAGGQSDAMGSDDFALARFHTFDAFCAGRAVTMLGTLAGDTLNGTAGADVIDSLAGNDVVNGLGGDDIICGGPGHDTLTGGGGKDRIFGGPGRDRLRGGAGNDWLAGEAGNDRLSGDGGKDRLIGGRGRDRCDGGRQRDRARACEYRIRVP